MLNTTPKKVTLKSTVLITTTITAMLLAIWYMLRPQTIWTEVGEAGFTKINETAIYSSPIFSDKCSDFRDSILATNENRAQFNPSKDPITRKFYLGYAFQNDWIGSLPLSRVSFKYLVGPNGNNRTIIAEGDGPNIDCFVSYHQWGDDSARILLRQYVAFHNKTNADRIIQHDRITRPAISAQLQTKLDSIIDADPLDESIISIIGNNNTFDFELMRSILSHKIEPIHMDSVILRLLEEGAASDARIKINHNKRARTE